MSVSGEFGGVCVGGGVMMWACLVVWGEFGVFPCGFHVTMGSINTHYTHIIFLCVFEDWTN